MATFENNNGILVINPFAKKHYSFKSELPIEDFVADLEERTNLRFISDGINPVNGFVTKSGNEIVVSLYTKSVPQEESSVPIELVEITKELEDKIYG